MNLNPTNPAATYNKDLLHEMGRRVFYKAMAQVERMIDDGSSNSEMMCALAQAAEAGANIFDDEDGEDE